MTLLLITNTKMIVKIFDLICSKNGIKFFTKDSSTVTKKYDIVVVDQSFIDEKFNMIKQFSKKIGAISNEELPFDKSRDFLISRPFLPHDLQTILTEQIEFIKEEERNQRQEEFKKFNGHDEAEDASEFIDTLVDDIASDIDDESDESIISIASMKNGGVLDRSELGKINTLLSDDDNQEKFQKEYASEEEMSEADWKDLSEIIDDALDEVKDYEFDLKEEIKNENKAYPLVLNNYNIDELKPLLNKCNQSIIDKLSDGQSVDLRLSINKG